MRLTRAERRAALAVAGMTAAVVVSGLKLLKKHARYMTQKAAAFFKESEETHQAAEETERTGAAGECGPDAARREDEQQSCDGEE